MSHGVYSEVGTLRKVLVCAPGLAHRRLTPTNAEYLLFDDVMWVQNAKRGHHGKVTPRALWKWARKSAEDALNNARVHGLFIKFWDGSKPSSHHDSYRSYRYGQLMTHAAPVALLAWLAAVREPAPGWP